MNKHSHPQKTRHSVSGYTVIELIVAVGLFTTVTIAAGGALLSAVDAYRKTISMRIIYDNLDSAIESMVRGLRTGSTYHCGSGGTITTVQNCPAGDDFIAFEAEDGDDTLATDQIIYRFNSITNQIERSTNGGGVYLPITAAPPTIQMTTVKFIVRGAVINEAVGDLQPSIVILLKGFVETKAKLRSEFSIQTTISQRAPDVPL